MLCCIVGSVFGKPPVVRTSSASSVFMAPKKDVSASKGVSRAGGLTINIPSDESSIFSSSAGEGGYIFGSSSSSSYAAEGSSGLFTQSAQSADMFAPREDNQYSEKKAFKKRPLQRQSNSSEGFTRTTYQQQSEDDEGEDEAPRSYQSLRGRGTSGRGDRGRGTTEYRGGRGASGTDRGVRRGRGTTTTRGGASARGTVEGGWRGKSISQSGTTYLSRAASAAGEGFYNTKGEEGGPPAKGHWRGRGGASTSRGGGEKKGDFGAPRQTRGAPTRGRGFTVKSRGRGGSSRGTE